MTKSKQTTAANRAPRARRDRLAEWLISENDTTAGERLMFDLLNLGGRPLVDQVVEAVGIEAGDFLSIVDELDERLRNPLRVE